MKYIVSGYIGFDNFGDEAIAHVLSEKLKYPLSLKLKLLKANFKILIEKDVSGGGSLLQDVTSLKSLIYYLIVIYSALFLRKKVWIYAQGIGPINSKVGQILTKFALKKAEKISVRDQKSQELLKSWGIESELVKDPIFELELPQNNSKGTVGVQLRKFEGVNDNFLEKLADEIAKRFSDKKIEVISLQDSIDTEVCEEFAQKLKTKGLNNVEVLKELSLNDVFETISNLEYLIAMRFHANVVGIKSGVKTLAINYDPKVEKLAQEYNLPYINLDYKDFSEQFGRLF